VHDALQASRGGNGSSSGIWLAGDSSLDNKHWLLCCDGRPAPTGLADVLEPPICLPDIAYHLNTLTEGTSFYCINSAIEESTLSQRGGTRLLAQDEFIRDNLRSQDVLVVSVGGNDIALKPSIKTIWNVLLLMHLNGLESIEDGPSSVRFSAMRCVPT
jgi:hypothetical protein